MLVIILAGGSGEMEHGNEGFVSANLTSELAASSSQNSLPGGSSESQPVVCGDLGPLLVLLRTHCQAQQCEPAQFFSELFASSSVSQPSSSWNSLQGPAVVESRKFSRAEVTCGLPDGSSRNYLPGSSSLIC